MALLVYVLLRYLAHLSNWPHSFTRLFGMVRCSLWSRINLLETLRRYGTARGHFTRHGDNRGKYLQMEH